jgi:hypothetical protein
VPAGKLSVEAESISGAFIQVEDPLGFDDLSILQPGKAHRHIPGRLAHWVEAADLPELYLVPTDQTVLDDANESGIRTASLVKGKTSLVHKFSDEVTSSDNGLLAHFENGKLT